MTSIPCDIQVLCGISNCFRLLFRTLRQITHALLTRPPLPVLLQTVRLECVKHAASVHPEPGSNSLKNSISTEKRKFFPLPGSYHFLELFSSFYYFCLSFFFQSSLTRSSHFSVFSSLLRVVQFSMSEFCHDLWSAFSSPSLNRLVYYIPFSLTCQGVLIKKIKNFFKRRKNPSYERKRETKSAHGWQKTTISAQDTVRRPLFRKAAIATAFPCGGISFSVYNKR